MISMDTSRPPFDDINVRKAVIAGFNRNAVRQQRGGEALGPIAQHFIPPGMAGFEESDGVEGWVSEMDWIAKPEGDRAKSAEYFKKAGMTSGKYEGDEELLIVGDNAEPDKSIAQITEQQLNELGFKTKLRLVTRDTMFTKFCNVPASEVNVCPSVGWSKDFSDPQTMLDPTFNGENIIPSQNSNWPELDDPEINKAIDDAKLVTDPAERAQAWADVNKMIMEQAPAIPYMWDYQAVVASPNMRGVQNGYSTTWDLELHLDQVGSDPDPPGAGRPAASRGGPAARSSPRGHPMAQYIIRRLLGMVLLLILVSAVTFVIFNVFPSTDPAALRAGRQPTPEIIEAHPPRPRPRPAPDRRSSATTSGASSPTRTSAGATSPTSTCSTRSARTCPPRSRSRSAAWSSGCSSACRSASSPRSATARSSTAWPSACR